VRLDPLLDDKAVDRAGVKAKAQFKESIHTDGNNNAPENENVVPSELPSPESVGLGAVFSALVDAFRHLATDTFEPKTAAKVVRITSKANVVATVAQEFVFVNELNAANDKDAFNWELENIINPFYEKLNKQAAEYDERFGYMFEKFHISQDK